MPAATSSALRSRLPIESAPVLGVLVVLTLCAAAVARRPSGIQGNGNHLLWLDVALLMVYGLAAVWVRYRRSEKFHVAVRLGSAVGLLLGAILVTNHVTELFVPSRNFAVVITPVLLVLALLVSVGSAAMARTASLLAAVIAGEWCAIVGVLVLLCVGFGIDVFAESRVEFWLRGAFTESGMSDPGGFALKNTLEAASEVLVRLPVMASLLSFLGALAQVLISRRRSRPIALMTLSLAVIMLVGGASALWYADALQRTRRPPFVMGGVLAISIALSAAFPIWSILHNRSPVDKSPSSHLRDK